MPPIFNDSRREFELKELCGACGHRNGLHSMYNKCPVTKPNGIPIPAQFKEQEFKRSGRYEAQAA